MKVVLAIDDSACSEPLLDAVCRRNWPEDTDFKVLNIIEAIPSGCQCDTDECLPECEIARRRKKHAEALCQKARKRILQAHPESNVHFDIRNGSPVRQILDAAVEWEADRILIGSHGHQVCPHNLPGSVSHGVASRAHCSVEVIRTDSPLAEPIPA